MLAREFARIPALTTIGNICAGNVNHIASVLRYDGVLHHLRELLDHQNTSICEQACFAISKITAGSTDQIELVIRANIIPSIVSVFRSNGYYVNAMAAWVLSNAARGGTDAQIRYLVNQGAIQPLCTFLGCSVLRLLHATMLSLERILCLCVADAADHPARLTVKEHGVDQLTALRHHVNEVIANKATEIMQTYFAIDVRE